jgi:hypothetical protein
MGESDPPRQLSKLEAIAKSRGLRHQKYLKGHEHESGGILR